MTKPCKSTAPQQSTPELETASQHNVLSPFFRLSPELRNRIYEFVFGGNSIHAVVLPQPHHNGSLLSFRLCRAVNDGTAHIRSTRDSPTCPGGNPDETYDTCHTMCVHTRFNWVSGRAPKTVIERLDLSILRVCTQIHAEAAMLPFTLNTFAFPSLDALTSLTQCVTTSQAQAVRAVTVCVHYGEQLYLQSPTRNALMGLRRLVVLYELPSTLCQSFEPLRHSGHSRTIESLLKLREIPFKSVSLRAYVAHPVPVHLGRYERPAKLLTDPMEYLSSLQVRLREIETVLLADCNAELATKAAKTTQQEVADE